MKGIFTGLLLILLDFNLNLGNSTIELLPDFVGYMIMAGGLLELEAESLLFIKVRPYSIGMAVYTGIIYVMDVFGISKSLGSLGYILGIITMAVMFYIVYNIVGGVKEMEASHGCLLNGDKLSSLWKWWVVSCAITYVAIFIPPLALVCIIISVVVSICFLVAFNTSKNMYYDMKS